MYKLKQMSSVWLIKLFDLQATWTEICDFFAANI